MPLLAGIITSMNIKADIKPLEARKGSRKPLIAVERNVLISKMIDRLCEAPVASHVLAKELRVNRATIEKYRPLADELIGKMKLDRNVIRNLQVQRTYTLIEGLMNDLKEIKGSGLSLSKRVTLQSNIYNQIYKFSSHLALITGLNIETQVNVDHQKLVIIRANNDKKDKNKPVTLIDQ